MTERKKGAIFDLDGVVTQTAKVHAKAWKQVFDTFLKSYSEKMNIPFQEFTYENDYLTYVDGKPRYKGVHSFLESRGIELPEGDPSDTIERETIFGIGNRKNDLFREIIKNEGAEIYETTVTLIRQLKAKGYRVGVASSSKNCHFILESTGLLELFESIIGGLVSKERGLKGKPHPDIFLEAARELDVDPSLSLLFEDAISGVSAGRNGNFGLVVGVSRNQDPESLLANGADMVFDDLGELTLETIEDWFSNKLKEDNWHLTYYGFDPENERLREALTTVGNGYVGTRGSMDFKRNERDTHYPGTYIAGLYNKIPTDVHGRDIYNNDFVNCPNWTLLELSINNSGTIDPLQQKLISYKECLDMKAAVLHRTLVFEEEAGRQTKIDSERFVSMAEMHLGGSKIEITPLNYSGSIAIRSAIDGNLINDNVARYRSLNQKHIKPKSETAVNGEIRLEVETTVSGVSILTSAHHRVSGGTAKSEIDKKTGEIGETFTFEVNEGQPVSLEKLVSIFTSKDQDVEALSASADDVSLPTRHYTALKQEHSAAWAELWYKGDFIIEGDRFAQKVARLHIYHLLVTASPNNKMIDAGMPARGLHGEAYRGHVFWDELFIFPFYNLHFPEITRSLLMYRYQRLDGARAYAKEHGFNGAMYPWQTADGGEEETQEVHYNPVSGKWDPDLSRRQRHVSIAIAYNIWEYYYCTNDLDFLYNYGAEMMLEIARFWVSIAEKDEQTDRYMIRGVMGPDEFHEALPGSTELGIKNNAYTNIMVSWLIHKTIETVEYLPQNILEEISKKINFEVEEMETWKTIIKELSVVIKDGILSQFDGYLDLKELDWPYYKDKYKNIHRMDRILKAEGDTPDNYKVAKQADVLMTYYVLSPGQIKNVLSLMGYDIGDEIEFMRKNYDYYVGRTSHGSTLSHVVHSAILKYLQMDKEIQWEWFYNALKSDILDSQGGTTPEGIHCGVMAGTLDIIMKSFAGISLFKDHIQLLPNLPDHWKKLSFKVQQKNNLVEFEITQDKVQVRNLLDTEKKVRIMVRNEEYVLQQCTEIEVKLK